MVVQPRITSQEFNQFVSLIAMLLVVDAGFAIDKISSLKVKTSPAVNPGEQADLLDKFLKLNLEAQRGAIRYIEKMRKGYHKEA